MPCFFNKDTEIKDFKYLNFLLTLLFILYKKTFPEHLFKSLTWPNSVNIKGINVIFSQNVLYMILCRAGFFTRRVTYTRVSRGGCRSFGTFGDSWCWTLLHATFQCTKKGMRCAPALHHAGGSNRFQSYWLSLEICSANERSSSHVSYFSGPVMELSDITIKEA